MDDQTDWKTTAKKESALFLVLLLVGVLFLPIAIYWVGGEVFGDYGSSGFSAFFGAVHRDLRDGQLVVWFLVLSPYLVWQLTRLTRWGFKRAQRQP